MTNVVDLDHIRSKSDEVHRFSMEFFSNGETWTGVLDGGYSSISDHEATADALEQVARQLRGAVGNLRTGVPQGPLCRVTIFESGHRLVERDTVLPDDTLRFIRDSLECVAGNLLGVGE